jgi:hypothetical protein
MDQLHKIIYTLGTDITIVGSRVNPNKALHGGSDYDYVLSGSHKTRNNVSRSLPGAKNINEGIPNNVDVSKEPLNTNLPYATFH